ncbi:HSP20 family protein [Marinactinospora thermotolerans DSM 45154]|uniref:HSP20 family protein n=2 Tax=Marinactinospora thermotolerans TaxID=531310 RepID=A0A1T4K6I8_9ACTN|nr:HSP20 family protein [Marinactinospora thermotolerans DSM 45154]
MLMRTDPFREFDRLTQRLLGDSGHLSALPMPMDAYRDGDTFVIHFDLPGVSPDSIDLEVERNVLTVRAERPELLRGDREAVVTERPTGSFSRQLFLGETLDADGIDASYTDGVLTLRIPVAEQAKPRKISIASGGEQPRRITA